MATTRIICIQTYHAHWAGHSGYHHFLSRLGDDFQVEHLRIARGAVSGKDLEGGEKLLFPLFSRYARKRSNSWTTPKDLLAEFRFWNRVRQGEFQREKVVLHFLDGEIGYNYSGAFRRLLGRKAGNVRLVASYHQPAPILEEVLRHRQRIGEPDLVLTVGRSQFPFFQFLSEDRLHFVPHGIDTGYFKPVNAVEERNRLFCLTVGHWLRDFDALEQVARSEPEGIVFRIVAGKEQVERFRELRNVEVYSGIEDDELLRLYQCSDIGLMPLQDATANNGLLEMMACGLPIITTRVGSVTDYLPEESGILLDKNESTVILAAVNRLVDSQEERHRLGEAARRRALELDWSNIARQMAELYLQV